MLGALKVSVVSFLVTFIIDVLTFPSHGDSAPFNNFRQFLYIVRVFSAALANELFIILNLHTLSVEFKLRCFFLCVLQ